MFEYLAFGAFLIAVAAGLFWYQRRSEAAWAADAERWPEAHDAETPLLAQRRRRRRTQICLLIGLVGLAVIGGTQVAAPLQFLVYWCSVLPLVFGIIGLGLADFWSTRRHVRVLYEQQRQATERMRAELEAEVARWRKPPA